MKKLIGDLTWRFGLFGALMGLAMGMSAQGLLLKETQKALELRLGQKAAFINTFYSFLIADALQRNDDVTLQQVVNRLEDDQEVVSVVVVDGKQEVRYHIDPEQLGRVYEDEWVKKSLEQGDGVMAPTQNSGGRALAVVAPLKAPGRPKPFGAVRIELTYADIMKQIDRIKKIYQFVLLGMIMMGLAAGLAVANRWVLFPLKRLARSVSALGPATSEPNLPETNDPYGEINKSLNEFIVKTRTELQIQQAASLGRGDQERRLLESLIRSFLPDHRTMLVDKDNLVIFDNAASIDPMRPPHLLDVVTDNDFATLVGNAFQQEGDAIRGPVTFQEKPFDCVIFRIPSSESVVVRTIIALKPR